MKNEDIEERRRSMVEKMRVHGNKEGRIQTPWKPVSHPSIALPFP